MEDQPPTFFQDSIEDYTHLIPQTGNSISKRPGTTHLLLHDRIVLNVLLLYGMLSFASIGFDELFPLWASTSAEAGGLSMTSSDLGTVLLGLGFFYLIFQTMLYPPLERRWGALRLFRIMAVVCAIMTMLTPGLRVFLPNVHLPSQQH
jgi:hypothetical protein